MKYIADRTKRIDASGIRKVFALAADLENPINLSIGQPDYDVDELVKDEAIAQIQAGFNSYTQTWGIEELRTACTGYYQETFGHPLENVMVTSGVAGGLFLTLLATIEPGDEVIFADPFFVMYKHLVNLLGGTCVPVLTYPDFKLTPEAVEAAITPKTKLLIVNSPSNPTGVVLTKSELQALADVAKKHELLVISDEIYEGMDYDGDRASMVGMYEHLVILNGFSKLAGMTGWRCGYAAGPPELIQQMNALQQYTFVCAPSFAQKGAVKFFDVDNTPKIEAYRQKRDIIYNGLRELGYEVAKPGGAFYIFPKVPGEVSGDESGTEFVTRAIAKSLLIIPGNVFSEKDTHFRISFAATDDTLKRALEVLAELV